MQVSAQTTPMQFSGSSSPNPSLAAEKFDYSTTFRQNVCSLQTAIDNNTVELQYSLRGMDLNAVALESEYFLYDNATGTLNEMYGGIIVEIMDELARRAGFRWRDSFTVIDDDIGNLTFTDLLEWTTNTYDISLDFWTFDFRRLALGVTFPEGWYDSTIIMVAKTSSSDPPFELWAWTEPFSRDVWLLIIGTVLFSGIMYWALELIDKHSDAQDLEQNLSHNVFLSGVNFTTHFLFQPRTDASRLFTWSLSFWAMVMGAAYTANLASFLVAHSHESIIQVNKLSDAINSKLQLCVLTGGAVNDTIYRNFGMNSPNVVGFDSTEDQFQGLNAGKCDLAVTEVYSWEYWERQSNVNSNCNLEWIGKAYKFIPAGFATISDSGSKCTSLITDVINYWMWNLKEEGFIDQAWQNHLDRLATKTCAQEESTDSSQSTTQMTMENMGGIFVFHGMLSVLSIIMASVYKCVGWDKKPRFSKTGPGKRKNVRKLLEERKRSGVALTKQEQRLLSASRAQSVPERIKRLTRVSFAPMLGESAASLPETTAVPDDPPPDIHDEDDLCNYLEPRRSSTMVQHRLTGFSVDMAGEIARLSSLQDEQVAAMKEVREQMNAMMDMMKEKLS